MTLRFIFYVILCFYIFVQTCSANYILCTSKCPQITVSFLQPLNIPPECQDNNTDINDLGLACVVDYRIDYDAKYIYINFKASNDPIIFQEYNQSEFLIQTIWLGFTEESGQPNITHRKYGCSTRNDCARHFYYDTIEHLITNGQLQLNQIKSKLYRKSLPSKRNATRRCKNSNTTSDRSSVPCRDGLCYINNVNERTFCAYDNTPTFFSEFEYYLPKSPTNEIELIEYKCNKHFCNSNKMLYAIKKILNQYTNWNSSIKNPINEEYSDQAKEDYPVIEQHPLKKENKTKEDYSVIEEHSMKYEDKIREEHPVIEEHSTKYEDKTREQYPVIEEHPTKYEDKIIEEHPAIDEHSTKYEDKTREEHPVIDEHSTKYEDKTREQYPVIEEHPTKYEDKIREEYPVIEQYPIQRENKTMDDYSVMEKHSTKHEEKIRQEYPVIEEYLINKENQTKQGGNIKEKSSTAHRNVSYTFIILTLLNIRFFF